MLGPTRGHDIAHELQAAVARVQVHQYAPSVVRTTLDDGREAAFEVLTEYPRSGAILVRMRSDSAEPWHLSLRVPEWAAGATLTLRPVDGGPTQSWTAAPGMVSASRAWNVGDEVVLELPTAPRFVAPDPRVDAVRGCLVVERGPEVFALESVDLAGTSLAASDFADLRVDASVEPVDVVGADGAARVVVRLVDERTDAAADVPLVPYHAWAERGPSTMRVWIPALQS